VSVKLNEKRGYWLIDTIWPRRDVPCITSARFLGITRSTLPESITPSSVLTQHLRTFFGCWKDAN